VTFANQAQHLALARAQTVELGGAGARAALGPGLTDRFQLLDDGAREPRRAVGQHALDHGDQVGALPRLVGLDDAERQTLAVDRELERGDETVDRLAVDLGERQGQALQPAVHAPARGTVHPHDRAVTVDHDDAVLERRRDAFQAIPIGRSFVR
jgi:hypothetical protein